MITRRVLDHLRWRLLTNEQLQALLPRFLRPAVNSRLRPEGGHPQWLREVMNADTQRELAGLRPETLNVAEISPDPLTSERGLVWGAYTALSFPEFDLCAPPKELPGPFDLVLCEQVLEHVKDPPKAVQTLRRLCRPSGHVLVSTPFLVRLHDEPGDYWRFTPSGLEILLRSQGLVPIWVRSWGNRRAIASNFDRWTVRFPWQTLRNELALPAVVWALARPQDVGFGES